MTKPKRKVIDFKNLPKAKEKKPEPKPHYTLVDSSPSISSGEVFAHVKDIGLGTHAQLFLKHSFASDEAADASAEVLARVLVIPFLQNIGFTVD